MKQQKMPRRFHSLTFGCLSNIWSISWSYYEKYTDSITYLDAFTAFLAGSCTYNDSSSISRGIQREILRKRPKDNNKAWIKLSEAILSILGDYWEKFICSSLPTRLTEKFPASKCTYNLQPDLLVKFRVWPKGNIHPFSWGEMFLTNSTYQLL